MALPKVTIPPATITMGGTGTPDGIVWNGNFLQFIDPSGAGKGHLAERRKCGSH
jgi:hypothetical protein